MNWCIVSYLLYLALTSIISAETTVDACAKLVTGNSTAGLPSFVNTVDDVEACFNLFPVTVADKKAQIDALKGYFNLYPYLDIAANVSTPYYPLKVDLFASLNAIVTNENITTERQMQLAISDVLNTLQDGHIEYTPQCFDLLPYMQPIRLVPQVSKTQTELFVHSFIQFENKTHNYLYNNIWTDLTNSSNLIGAKVMKINGQDSVDFVQAYADRYYGLARAPETRFNTMFPSYNNLGDQSLLNFATSPQDTLTFELILMDGSSSNISVSWVAIWSTQLSSSFSSSETYYQTFCTSLVASRDNTRFSRREKNLQKPTSSFQLDVLQNLTVNNGYQIIKYADFSTFAILDDNVTGVWLLPTWWYVGGTNTEIFEFIATITSGLQSLQDAGAQKLIIDFTGNTGGLIEIGWLIANYLFAGVDLQSNLYTARLPDSLSKLFTDVPSIILDNGVIDKLPNNVTISEVSQVISPGVYISGYLQKFTNELILGVDPFAGIVNGTLTRNYPFAESTGLLLYSWAPENVVIVSNGLCGSTCAQFVSYIRDQVPVVRTVTYGGGKTRTIPGILNFDPTAYAAGAVQDFESLSTYFTYIPAPPAGVPDEDLIPVPFPFPTYGQIPFFTSFSPYGKHPEMPIEWDINPSECFLEDVLITDPAKIWMAVMASDCAPGKVSSTATGTSFNSVSKSASTARTSYTTNSFLATIESVHATTESTASNSVRSGIYSVETTGIQAENSTNNGYAVAQKTANLYSAAESVFVPFAAFFLFSVAF
ncbi:hypothetical protein HK100_006414 [Physocladia obscura]|uniref:CPAF-like PDZ domain-containing protein n=1 Tax=Physocladia obscura TaxID=109957 RepID=A0AAD5XIK6_9FUNG|nr:hypothetical protein HK100_006414 [Physocladia obscura]